MNMRESHSTLEPDYRKLFESAPGLFLVLAPDFSIVAVSDAYLQATMTERSSIVGRGLFEVFPDNPGDSSATGTSNLGSSLRRVLKDVRPDAMAVQKYDIRRPASEGGGFEERYWSPINYPILDGAGRIVYLLHRVEDVTDFVRLKRQGTEQVELTEGLKARMEAMGAEVYRRAQEIQEANRQLRELQTELEARVEARTSELQKANEELRRSEEQLRQTQKMEAIGRLAGGVAHDFNNLLMIILGHCEFLQGECGPNAPMSAGLDEIKRAGERAADLTRQLLAFSRQQVLDAKVLDLNEILNSMKSMLARLLGEHIELRSTTTAALGHILADRSQIEQILMNLVVNARDAMPQGGTLTIETANVELTEEYAREHLGAQTGPHVMLAVSDTGAGMDKATQARIFEPFFTTKERGKGTGLGLSTVFGIVKQSGGSIWVYSEPCSGTTFKVYFPRTESVANVREAPSTNPSPLIGSETVLIVEDQDKVRAVAATILRARGYRVLEARDGEEALRICEAHPEDIHVLVTDVIMPKMNGRDLAEKATSIRRELRVLFMSGYTDDVIVHHGVLRPGVLFLQKPFTPTALAQKVREAIDAPLERSALTR